MQKEPNAPDNSPLTLYLEYDYLTVIQHASMLWSLAGIYEALLPRTMMRPGQFFIWAPARLARDTGYSLKPVFGPPLCISSAETSSSIELKFSPEGRWFPSLTYAKGDLEVMIPRWTAAVVLVGAALTYGMGQYKEFLEIQKNQLEIEKLRIEIEQLQVERTEQDPQIQIHINEFRLEASAPNLRRVEINGVPARRHE